MNYYNPYFSTLPYNYAPLSAVASANTSRGLLSSLFGGGKLSTFLNGTQKTLNIVNQAIPLVKQMGPVVKNAKTMFRVMNEFKKVDVPIKTDPQILESKEEIIEKKSISTNSPTFFL